MGLMDDVKSKKKQKEAENWYSMGIKSPDPEKKLEYFTRSLELEPNNVSGWVKRGRILEDMGKFDEAKRSYDRATLLDPSLDISIKRTNSFTENDRISTPEYIPTQPEYIQDETEYIEEEEQHLATESPAETDYYEAEETEEVESFTPPQGEESIFSNIREKESFVVEDEIENVSMDTESAKSSGSISFAPPDEEIVPDNNLPRQNTSEITNETVAATSLAEQKKDDVIKRERTPTFNKRPASNNYPVRDSEKKEVQPGTSRISSYVEMEGKNTNLRIPLSETIKFWLIGAIVLLVFYLITRLI
ncbi:MAG: tetratricopeptide repeat protein [Methanomethylovorans sp.]|uniref:tetratricopeptide repeat protein n=1 Tax=Methanomethylovorans sp. TaxID=2758717 RepID=UPI003530E166